MNAKEGLAAAALIALLIGCSAEPPASSSPGANSPVPTGPPPTQPTLTPTTTAAAVSTATAAPLPTANSTAASVATSTAPPATPAGPTASFVPSTPGADGWIGPEQVAEGGYFGVALVLDANGGAHVAAEGRTGIWYLTNATGAWTRERLTTTARHELHDSVAIALDDSDGSLYVAYAQRADNLAPNFSRGVSYVTNRSGAWSEPVDVPGSSERPLLAVSGGSVHLASEDYEAANAEELDDLSRALYITNSTGDWSAVPIADPGRNIALRLSADGRVELIVESWQPGTEQKTIYVATRNDASGLFEMQPIIDQFPRFSGQVVGFLDRAGEAHLFLGLDDPQTSTYVRGRPDALTEPEVVPFIPERMDVDALGAVHGIASERYLANVGGAFVAKDLSCDCANSRAAIAVDSSARPHLVIATEEGIWYAVGPGA